jgi:hypothetical protein
MARGELTRHFRTSSKATTLLDLPEPGRPVVEHVREDHADHPWPIRECGGVKQGIYSRALPIFLWTYAELNVALVDELMLVRGRHINVAVPDWTTIRRMTGREPSLTAQDLRSLLTLRGGKCRVTNRAAGKSAAVVKQSDPTPPRRRQMHQSQISAVWIPSLTHKPPFYGHSY